MNEYTEFLKEYLGERRDITKKVFKIVGRIYKAIENGASDEQIETYISILKNVKHNWLFEILKLFHNNTWQFLRKNDLIELS